MPKQRTLEKTNRTIICLDLASIVTGIIGVILGITSILALEPFWNNDTASYNVTCVAILFDTSSALLALLAFLVGYRFLRSKKEALLKESKKDYLLELQASILDFISFSVGVIGTIFEIISLLALWKFWNNTEFSYQITIVGVICDIISNISALSALLLTLKLVKKHNQKKIG